MEYLLIIVLATALLLTTWLIYTSSLRKRPWSPDQAVLTSISTYGENVTIHNMRQARYRSEDDYDVAYSTFTFKLSDITKMWCMIEPFADIPYLTAQPSHVTLSFELESGFCIVVSAEVRRRKGQVFDPLKGLFRGFKLIHVITDEEDTIKMRSVHREHVVRLYPLTLTTEQSQKVFTKVIKEVNDINTTKPYYNTLTSNCATNLIDFLRISGIKLPKWHYSYLLPSALDEVLYDARLIDTKLSLEDAREYFNITKKAKTHTDQDFSRLIRENIATEK